MDTPLCECGCGNPVMARPGRRQQSRFLRGHNVRLEVRNKPREPRHIYEPQPEEIPSGTCECGCGEQTEIAQKTYRKIRHFRGHPLPFKRGHSKTGSARGEAHHNWKGGRTTNYGYVLVYAPEHPQANSRGYCYEHRLVMERVLGRLLERHETVHHRDGNRANNDPANLELWRGKHGSGVRGEDYHCPGCRCERS